MEQGACDEEENGDKLVEIMLLWSWLKLFHETFDGAHEFKYIVLFCIVRRGQAKFQIEVSYGSFQTSTPFILSEPT